MQKIYLARPGAQKEGPFTIEQINHDLATKKISDTDFWAWHEGLPAWTPLYSVAGVSAKAWVAPDAKPQRITTKSSPVSKDTLATLEPRVTSLETVSVAVSSGREVNAKVAPVVRIEPEEVKSRNATVEPAKKPISVEAPFTFVTKSEPETLEEKVKTQAVLTFPKEESAVAFEAAPLLAPRAETPPADRALCESTAEPADALPDCSQLFATPSMSSGKPFAALEQVFVFTSGQGPSAIKSRVTIAMLIEAVGQKFDDIRTKVPLDVIGGTAEAVLEAFRAGSIPGSAWRAMARIKPSITQQAQDGVYHLCVRTFPLESKDLVALFLLYNKQKP
jgi:hypothetical protein